MCFEEVGRGSYDIYSTWIYVATPELLAYELFFHCEEIVL